MQRQSGGGGASVIGGHLAAMAQKRCWRRHA
jgi:hypothetical protein